MKTASEIGPEALDGPCAVVYLTASFCHACSEPVPWLEEIESRTEGVTFVKVVVDKHQGADRYHRGIKALRGYPFTIIYKNGNMIDFFYGHEGPGQYKMRVVHGIREFMKGG